MAGDHEFGGLQQHVHVVADLLVGLHAVFLFGFLGHLFDVFAVFRLALGAHELHGLANLGFGHPRALHTNRLGGTHRQEQRIALTNQGLGTDRVKNDSRIGGGRGGERQSGWNVGLDQTGDHVHGRTLGGEHQMHTGGSCQLGDALDGAFHIVLGHHHKVGHLVDHHEDVRIGGHLALGAGGRMYLAGAHGLVEVLDVAESEEFEVGVACIHLFDHPFEGLCGFLRIGDDRGQQVRDACVGGQFHALGIHHDQTHLFGRGTHDDRSEHRVDKTRLTGTGGTGHQQVRHLGQVGGHEVAFDVLADAGEHRVRVAHGLVGAQYVAQVHDFAILVRDFDADGGFAGNR